MDSGQSTVQKIDEALRPFAEAVRERFDAACNAAIEAIGERFGQLLGAVGNAAKETASQMGSGIRNFGTALKDQVSPKATPGQKIEKPQTERQKQHGMEAGQSHKAPDLGSSLSPDEKAKFEAIAANFDRSTAKYGNVADNVPNAQRIEFENVGLEQTGTGTSPSAAGSATRNVHAQSR
ncbi:MAG TPA: hypothetical protein VFT64_06930 [Rickettsiales bacterium]|nr:hypothetical protein [Rickettsiales bacterium]